MGLVGELLDAKLLEGCVGFGLVEFSRDVGARHLYDHGPVSRPAPLEQLGFRCRNEDLSSDIGEHTGNGHSILLSVGFTAIGAALPFARGAATLVDPSGAFPPEGMS